MFNWENVPFKKINKVILKSVAATHLKKKLGQCHVYHGVASPNFLTTLWNVWKLRRPVARGLGEECCSILSLYRIRIALQSWIFFVVFFIANIINWWYVFYCKWNMSLWVLQFTAFCFYVDFIQCPNFFGLWVVCPINGIPVEAWIHCNRLCYYSNLH